MVSTTISEPAVVMAKFAPVKSDKLAVLLLTFSTLFCRNVYVGLRSPVKSWMYHESER